EPHLDLRVLARRDLRLHRAATAHVDPPRDDRAGALRVDRAESRHAHPREPLAGADAPRDRRAPRAHRRKSPRARVDLMAKHTVTPATAFLTQNGVEFTEHAFAYVDHGGTAASSSALGVPEHAEVKTLWLVP